MRLQTALLKWLVGGAEEEQYSTHIEIPRYQVIIEGVIESDVTTFAYFPRLLQYYNFLRTVLLLGKFIAFITGKYTSTLRIEKKIRYRIAYIRD